MLGKNKFILLGLLCLYYYIDIFIYSEKFDYKYIKKYV